MQQPRQFIRPWRVFATKAQGWVVAQFEIYEYITLIHTSRAWGDVALPARVTVNGSQQDRAPQGYAKPSRSAGLVARNTLRFRIVLGSRVAVPQLHIHVIRSGIVRLQPQEPLHVVHGVLHDRFHFCIRDT